MNKINYLFGLSLIAVVILFSSCQSQIKFNSAEQEADSLAIQMKSPNERVKTEWGKTINLYNQRNAFAVELINIVDKSTNGSSTVTKELATSLNKYKLINKSVDLLINEELFNAFTKQEEELNRKLGLVFALAQKNNIKNSSFLEIQMKLEDKQNRISVQRKRFNAEAQSYNTKIKQVANDKFFKKYPDLGLKCYFQRSKEAKEAPAVKF